MCDGVLVPVIEDVVVLLRVGTRVWMGSVVVFDAVVVAVIIVIVVIVPVYVFVHDRVRGGLLLLVMGLMIGQLGRVGRQVIIIVRLGVLSVMRVGGAVECAW